MTASPPVGAPHGVDALLLDALRGVVDPELGSDVVELGMIRKVSCHDGVATVSVALTIAGCPLRDQIRRDVEGALLATGSVDRVVVELAVMDAQERRTLMETARRLAQDRTGPTAVGVRTRVLGIVSGKGGVGKSTVSVNLAVALASGGLAVGLLDADIWGFSIPRMLGITAELSAVGGKIIPIDRTVGTGVVRVVSMGFLSGEDDAVMWRGLMLNRAVQHFLEDVEWGELDYLVIDMPPGTGDVQMGLAKMLPRTELVVVTTPALAAQKVAGRAADMGRRSHLRIAGVIENMSAYAASDGTTMAVFGSGGGDRLAREIGVPLIGSIPLDPAIASGGDLGTPIAGQPDAPSASVFTAIAERISREIAPAVELSSCTARLVESAARFSPQLR